MSSTENLRNEVLNFGPKIKEIRNKKRFTVRQAALQAGISPWNFKLAGITKDQNNFPTKGSHYYDLTEKDERNIDKELEDMMNGLDSKHSLSFFQNGQELSDQDKELLKASMRQTLELSKQLAKRKFTPKKYRNGEE